MVLSLGPLVVEASLLEGTACAVVEKRAGSLLALRVLWIRLHHTTTGLRNQVQGTTKRHSCDALAPEVPVDEEASEAVVGLLVEACVVLLPVVNVRKLLRRAVFAPGDGDVTVEDLGRMGLAFAN
jgi:hypothetical protein